MRNTILAFAGVLLLSGCSMKEFSSSPLYTGSQVKFTGAVEDRVNLWPAAYYRKPVGSLAWPLISWGDDHWAIRPLYSQYKQDGKGDYDEFNVLWPLAQLDTKRDDNHIFPFFWGKDAYWAQYFCLFPLVWKNNEFCGVFPFFWDKGDNSLEDFTVFPFFWYEKFKHGNSHSLLPLYSLKSYKDSCKFQVLWPLFQHESDEKQSKSWALCHLAWLERNDDGKLVSHAFLPFYIWNRYRFCSLPYSRHGYLDTVRERFLCGLAGRYRDQNGKLTASWAFPLYYSGNDKLITPIYGKTKDASWTLPLYYKDNWKFLTLLGGKAGDEDWVVPFYWRNGKTFASLPYWRRLGNDGKIDWAVSLPLLSAYERDTTTGRRSLGLLLGLGGRTWDESGNATSWMWPLFYNDEDSFYSIFYGHSRARRWICPVYFENNERIFITPFYGRNKRMQAHWLFPLYYRNPDTFVTPLFGKSMDSKWILPLYFENEESIYVTPFYKHDKKKQAHWLFPLYYRNRDTFFTPLFGWSGNSSWLLPIYSRDELQLNTPLFSYWNYEKMGARGFFSLPLLSGGSWATNSCHKSWFTLAGLVGGTSNASGTRTSKWAVPIFHRSNDSFTSLLYGWKEGKTGCTNTYFLAGLAGVKSGKSVGGWLFPAFHREADADYGEKAKWLDAERLPDDIKIWTTTTTNRLWNSVKMKAYWETTVTTNATDILKHDNGVKLLVSDDRRHIYGSCSHSRPDVYTLKESRKIGNVLAFNHKRKRTVDFDMKTRKKVADTTSFKSSLFGCVYTQESSSDAMKGTSESTQRILWKLWHREEKNGNVSLDVFPGFTYDSRKDGYSKTSFLWRLFRYENDPKTGKKADVLFLPVLR